MFLQYVQDMKSWIGFFFACLFAVDVLLWVDPALSVTLVSAIYLNGLLILVFILFFIWRYRRETVYTKKLMSSMEELADDWTEALPETSFQRDETINEMLSEIGKHHTDTLSKIRAQTVIQSDYTAAWVHEAKAPLTAMKLILDGNREIPEMQRIETEWLRLHLLIDQQLYISRIPSLETDYALETIDLQSIVFPEVRELMTWCREKNLAIETEGLETDVVTDRKWSRFVVRQFLTNAVKYSPEGGVIHIRAQHFPEGNAVLAIEDNGPGIAPHDLPRIFDKGFTGSTGRLQNAATGLGLYLAKTVSEKIGIGLSVHSGDEGGTHAEMAFTLENEYDRIRK